MANELTAPALSNTKPASKGVRGLSWVARPLVSLALLAFLLRGTRLTDFWHLAQGASLSWLAVGIALVVLALLVSAYKWQWLLIVQGIRVPFWHLFNTYLVGLFFNNFLPTNIGGDVVRIHDVARYSGKTPQTVASVVSERLLASLALAFTAALGLVFSFQVAQGFAGVVLLVFALSLAVIGAFAKQGWRRALSRWFQAAFLASLRHKLGSFADAMSASLQNKRIVSWVLLWSLVFHLIVVLLNYVIFLALGLNVPFIYTLMVIPIISAIQMLPISVNGLGVREGAYVYFFAFVGLTTPQAVTASLTFWALVALVSLVGGAIFALRR